MASCLFCPRRKAAAAAHGEFVKLVFPGGHVELLDRPVLAAEILFLLNYIVSGSNFWASFWPRLCSELFYQ
uniref:Uncharacterized protein n=1 Tax=Oryza brachyantha TaxID=4533 RepID=J3MF58_ORYBR